MADKQAPRRVLSMLVDHPWAILPSAFETMLEVVCWRFSGAKPDDAEIAARIEAARRPTPAPTAPGSIAVIPIIGPISQRMTGLEDYSGGTSAEAISAMFRQAVADPGVSAIILDVDSPGGSVYGIEELANLIFSSRGEKPIIAVANAMAASAAYWIASQADELVVTPSGEVGSVGVIAAHDDLSAAAEMAGIKRTYITSSKYKAEGNAFEPLPEDAKAYIQRRVDEYDAAFVKAIARGRKVNASTIRRDFGEGRMVGAAAAVQLGMADREGTLLAEIERAVKRQGKGARAEAEAPASLAEEPAVVEVVAAAPPEPDEAATARARAMARLRLAGAGAA